MAVLVDAFRVFRRLHYVVSGAMWTPIAKIKLLLNGVPFGPGLRVRGPISVTVTRRGRMRIGTGVRINGGSMYNIIGRQQKMIFWVDGDLTIGDHVGMSGSAIICHDKIEIGTGVLIGGNVVVYDTDFHSLDADIRSDRSRDRQAAKHAPVSIGRHAFIGAHTTILKGVRIGEKAVIGAGSVVARNIPPCETWAGNPARNVSSGSRVSALSVQ